MLDFYRLKTSPVPLVALCQVRGILIERFLRHAEAPATNLNSHMRAENILHVLSFIVPGVPLADLDVRWGPKDAKITNGHCLILSSNEEEYLMYTSSCDSPLPYICYRKRDNVTINKCCGTFDHGKCSY